MRVEGTLNTILGEVAVDACDRYMQQLEIEPPWRVTDAQILPAKCGVCLRLAYEATSVPCPKCHSQGKVTRFKVTSFSDAKEQWPDTSTHPIVLNVSVPRATCDTHGEFRAELPWKATKSQWLLARHLEVFVPKLGTRELEIELSAFLDNLLRKSDLPLISRGPSELEKFPERARSLLRDHDRWENIICGYSTYLTDGAFLDGTAYPREPRACLKEQTLVLKFILTNYRTTVEPGRGRFLGLEGLLLREVRQGVDEARLTELLCTESHYSDVCEYVVRKVADDVLDGQMEVWSQEWLTVLNRWKRRRVKDPIAESKEDKKLRFLASDRVLCTVDYCAPFADKVETEGSSGRTPRQ